MKFLAFDTSTEVLSIGLADGGASLLHTGAGGAQASFGLIAGVQALLAQAQWRMADLDGVVFGAGPGSFTGLRTACAVAQGLALGAGVPVLPVHSLLAVAEDARLRLLPAAPSVQLLALLDARMDEVYAGTCVYAAGQWQTVAVDTQLGKPETVVVAAGTDALVGNVFAVYPGRVAAAGVPCHAALPSAQALLSLAPALWAQGLAVAPELALPLYVRDKVAKTTAEREQEKAAKAEAVHG